MAKMMTKSAVVSTLAEKCALTKKQVVAFLEELQSLAMKEAKKNGFIVPGFGKLVLANRKARMGRNPQSRNFTTRLAGILMGSPGARPRGAGSSSGG